LWAYFFCQGSNHLDKDFIRKFLRSVYDQAYYIENHLSYYSSPYNHLIGEAAALHLIGSLFPNIESGKRWEHLGWSILVEKVDNQFHDDGMSREQASFYHHFTLGFYLQSIFLRRNNNKETPQKVLSRIERALDFSLHLTKPGGTLPMVGDIDNARSIYFNPLHQWDFRGYLALGAVLFNRPDFKSQGSGSAEELLWLVTEKDFHQFQKMRSLEPKDTSRAFCKSGYFISRERWYEDSNYLCFDCGEIADGLFEGPVPSAAHGHADALSFELVAHGKSFIVDGGFYTYIGDLDWHKYFRRQEAHNTVLLGNHRQAEYCGRLTWQRVKRPRLLQWENTEIYDAVTGCLVYANDTLHFRQMIFVKKHLWLLRDSVETKNEKEPVKSFLHFAPSVDLSINEDSGELIASKDDVGLRIRHFGQAEVDIKRGGNTPASGWVAHGYGIKHPAWRVVFSWETSDSKGSSTLLMIPFKVEKEDVSFEEKGTIGNDSASTISFQINKTKYALDISQRDRTRFNIDSQELQIPFPECIASATVEARKGPKDA